MFFGLYLEGEQLLFRYFKRCDHCCHIKFIFYLKTTVFPRPALTLRDRDEHIQWE